VVDEARNPIAGATVHLSPAGAAGQTTTDLEGRYEISGVRAREYQVTVRADGRTPVAETLRVPGERDFVLLPGLTIEGQLSDHEGHPVFAVVLAVTENGTQGGAAGVDGNGRFVIEGLAPGVYTLRAQFHGGPWRPALERQGVAAGSRDVDLRLPAPGCLTGRVLGPDGASVPWVEVYAISEHEAREVRSTWTDGEGRFRIEGLYDDLFKVRVNLNKRLEVRNQVAVARALSEGYAVRDVRNVAVGTTGLVLRAEGGLEVSGVVIGIEGDPAAGAVVSLIAEADNGASGAVTTDERGSFALRGLAPGRYRLKSWAKDGTQAELSVDAGTAGLRVELRQK